MFLEYNPNLGEVTRATRVAYVKFMKKKMAAEEDVPLPEPSVTTENEKPKPNFTATLKRLDVCGSIIKG